MKTACDHFLITPTAEILRAAKYQLDLMAARHEGTRQTETEGHEQGGNITETDMQETNKRVHERGREKTLRKRDEGKGEQLFSSRVFTLPTSRLFSVHYNCTVQIQF